MKKVKLSSLYGVQKNKIKNYILSLDSIIEILSERPEIDDVSEKDMEKLVDYFVSEQIRAMKLLEKEED